jgi:hypothetical protein
MFSVWPSWETFAKTDLAKNETIRKALTVPSDYKFVGILDYCPVMGPQRREGLSAKDIALREESCKGQAMGWCHTWSIMYALERILNPRWSSKAVSNSVMTPLHPGEPLYFKVARFQTFIDNTLGIPEKENLYGTTKLLPPLPPPAPSRLSPFMSFWNSFTGMIPFLR